MPIDSQSNPVRCRTSPHFMGETQGSKKLNNSGAGVKIESFLIEWWVPCPSWNPKTTHNLHTPSMIPTLPPTNQSGARFPPLHSSNPQNKPQPLHPSSIINGNPINGPSQVSFT